MKNRLLPLAREPLVQFLLIGTCIYAAYAFYGAPPEAIDDKAVIVNSARVESFIGQWEKRWNRPPTRQELDGVIEKFVHDDILYRQAIAMGLDKDDPVTRRRMAQKLEFLTSDIALFKEPAVAELEKYFKDHQARYREADRITFRHVFIDPDLRGDSTLDDAAELLAQLRAAGEPDTPVLESGDRLMSQDFFDKASQLDVQRELGSGFAEAVMGLEPRKWHGPVLSGFGVHLVYILALQPAPQPAFEDVRSVVLADWQKEQQERFNADFYESLKSGFEIVIAEPPAGGVLDPASEPRASDESRPRVQAANENPAP
jgi:peptidyl-prolyl cis-trans isomerase C